MIDLSFYRGKKVLITGNTGFKGTWMCKALLDSGALVTGYALKPSSRPNLWDLLRMEDRMESIEGDVRDLEHLMSVFQRTEPEIVIHMAAQPIVRESYRKPVYTYDVNVMGTVNVMECIRMTSSVRSCVNVTTDKVYKNREWEWGYRENEELNGYDPYSNSKSCSELVTASYKNAFLSEKEIAVSTARAGNVIGGGDYATDRIVPDCVRAMERGERIMVRNPYSIRPYQHVLEPVMGYLMIAQKQYEDIGLAGSYNIGPDECDCITTGELVNTFCRIWNERTSIQNNRYLHAEWSNQYDGGPHEANFLKLDCSRMKDTFGWKPMWHLEKSLDKVIEWTLAYMNKEPIEAVMERQIEEYGR